jgi:hypothetical protein
MADNTTLNTGTGGDVIATDDISGVKYQRVKLVIGADGVNDGDVSSSNALPVSDNGSSLTVDGTVTANAGTGSFTVAQATAANLNATVVGTGTFAVQADTELPAAAALADGASNPTSPAVGAYAVAFNGTSWDRVKTIDGLSGTAANNTTVGILAVGTGPGYAHRYNPTALATAINSASTFEVEGANTMTWGIGTTTTGTFIFEATSDATNGINVEVFDAGLDQWVSGQNLTPTSGKTYHVACGGYRQIRIRVTATLGATVSHVVNASNSQQLLAGIDTGAAPHNFGYSLVHKDAEYSTAQTGAALWTPPTGKKFAVTDITITTGGTTAGIVTLWQSTTAVADTTYNAGTDLAIFRGEFAPSTTSKPGVVKSFNAPYVASLADYVLRVTTSAAMTVYIQVNGYEV